MEPNQQEDEQLKKLPKIKKEVFVHEKILIIDNDIEFVRTASQVLEDRNYEVASIMDISNDFEYFQMPDLIVIASMIFNCEKCEQVLEKIKNTLQKDNTPIIVITNTERKKYLSSDFYADIDWKLVKNTLNKPVKALDLLKCVRYVLSKQKIAA